MTEQTAAAGDVSAGLAPPARDRTNYILRWILLITLVSTSAVLIWGTYKTYQLAPPIPARISSASGELLATRADIVQGKAAFQRADLMDYGSLFGMGSYFREDYTAEYLHRLARQTEGNIAQARFGKAFNTLSVGEQHTIRSQA